MRWLRRFIAQNPAKVFRDEPGTMIKKGVKKTMTNIKLQNPYMDETIKVKENLKRILDMLEWLEVGNIQYLQLQQLEPEKRVITISPKNFAKIDYYEAEGVDDEI